MRQHATELDLLADELVQKSSVTADPLLGLKKIKEMYGCGRWVIRSAIDRRELAASEGPHNHQYLIRQSELERWLSSKPYSSRVPKQLEWADSEDEAERQLLELARRCK